MEYVELTLDSQLAENSADSNYDKLDWPVFNLGQRIQGIQAVKLVEVAIPKTWNNWFRADSDFAYIAIASLVTSAFYFIDIPAGTYTAETFIAVVNAELASASFQAWLVTNILVTGPIDATMQYSATSGKFSFVFEGNGNAAPGDLTDIFFALFGANQPSNFFLGYPDAVGTFLTGTAESASYEMPERARINWPNYLQVASRTIGDLTKAYNPLSLQPTIDYFGNLGAIGTTGQSNPQFGTVPNNVEFGETITWQDPDPSRFLSLNGLFQLSTIDIYLTNGPFSAPLRLNGLNYMVKIGLLVDKPNSK